MNEPEKRPPTQQPLQLQVAVFQDVEAADRCLDELRQAQKSRIIAARALASVRYDEDGQLKIKELDDPGGTRGAIAGGLIGVVVGLLGGPGGAIVAGAAGALVGGFTASIVDSGIPDQNLELIGQSLLPDESAIVIVVEARWQDKTSRIMAASGARVLTGSLTSVIAKQLELPPDPVGPADGDSPVIG
jgi:uncharacterized membrane protein